MSSLTKVSAFTPRVTVLSRTPRSSFGQFRYAHSEHGAHKHLPFEYHNRKAFAVKFFAFCMTGFSIPFIAVTYQLHKSGGVA